MSGLEDRILSLVKELEEEKRLADKRAKQLYLAGGGGNGSFIGHNDTPATYAGQAGKFVKVNAVPDALEFANISLGDLPAHASTHHSGGGDPLAFASIAGFGTYLDQAVKQASNPTFGSVYITDSTCRFYKSSGIIQVRSESVNSVDNFSYYGMYLPLTGQTYNLFLAGSLKVGHAESGKIDVVGYIAPSTGLKLGAFYLNSLIADNKVPDSNRLNGQLASYYALASLTEVNIADTRDDGDVIPTDFPTSKVKFSFTDEIAGSPNEWESVMTMRGWGTDYRVWQLMSSSSRGGDADLYFRSGAEAVWGDLRKVWDEGNDGTGSGLDADKVDGIEGAELLQRDGSVLLTVNWDAGSYQIRAKKFYSDQVTGTAPFIVNSATKVVNLNVDRLDDQHGSYYSPTTHGHAHGDLSGVTSDQHHPQSHTLASHSTKPHSALTGITANQHHDESHTLASHSTKPHSALTDVTSDQHHAQAHVLDGADHSISGKTPGHFLKALTATTFGFAAHGLTYSDVGAAATSHSHVRSNITDFWSESFWANIPDKPSTFTPSAHALVGAKHTASGLTVGHIIKATGATTFAWGQLPHDKLGGLGDDDHTQYYNSTRHTKVVHDALNIDADTVDGEEASAIVTDARVKAHFPDTVANILSDHNLATHNALGITTLGTVGTGVWQGTAIANAYVAGIDQNLLQASSPSFAGLALTGNRPFEFSTAAGDLRIKGNASGWATGYGFKGSGGTDFGEFGGYGSIDSFYYFYVGPDYTDWWLKIASSLVEAKTNLKTPKLTIGSYYLNSLIANNKVPDSDKLDNLHASSFALTTRKLDDFGTPDDNTDLNASTEKHGLLMKLGGGTTNFLRADGTWASPLGALTFLTLTDTPANYTDHGGKIVRVKSAEDGLEFVSAGAPAPHASTHHLSGSDEVNHDSLFGFVAAEHFLQSAITTVGTIGTGVWQGTAIGWNYVSKTGSNLTDLATRQHAGLTDITSGQHHAQVHASEHHVGGGDLINHDSLTGFVATEHLSLPNTIANVLSDHDKAVHDALGIDADTVDTYHLDQNVLIGSSPTHVTVKLSGLTDGYIPYHISDAVGLANSPFFVNGANVGIGTDPGGNRFAIPAYDANVSIRIAGTTVALNKDAISIGAYGNFSMDAPGVGGGRFKIDDAGNVSIVLGNLTFSSATSTITGGTSLNLESASAIRSQRIAANTTANAPTLHITDVGYMQRSTSALKYKDKIKDLEIDSSLIYKFQPRSFNSKCAGDDKDRRFIGLVADEVGQICPDIVNYNENNEAESYDSQMIITLLLAEAQRHEARIKELEAQLNN